MPFPRCILLALAAAGLAAGPAAAHYTMLLPQTASARKGQTVTVVYQWGHPFEHQLFDAPAPKSLSVIAPEGKKTDLKRSLKKTTVPGPGGKKVIAYEFSFTPRQRGDYVFVLSAEP